MRIKVLYPQKTYTSPKQIPGHAHGLLCDLISLRWRHRSQLAIVHSTARGVITACSSLPVRRVSRTNPPPPHHFLGHSSKFSINFLKYPVNLCTLLFFFVVGDKTDTSATPASTVSVNSCVLAGFTQLMCTTNNIRFKFLTVLFRDVFWR